MKKLLPFYLLLCLWMLASGRLPAQSPNDAIMMKAKQACILLEYNYASFDHYWEGGSKRINQTIATVHRNTVLPMAAIGIVERLNLYVGVPYISTGSSEPNGGRLAGVSGFQDLTLALKYKWLGKEIGNGELSGFATVGFSTPITNYLPDYAPYSLGLGAPELSYRAILQYKFSNGWYFRGTGAYLWRGYSKAEREYYYNNGSFYTPWMDVPNAITTGAVIGKWLFKNSLQLEVNYVGSQSLSGDDIRAYNAAQPTNKVDMDGLGVLAHYYFPGIKGLGIIAYHNRTISGRNAPQISTTSVGVTYFFNYLKTKKNEQ